MGLSDIVFIPKNEDVDAIEGLRKNLSFDSVTKKKGISIDKLLDLIQKGNFENTPIHEVLESCDMELSTPPPVSRNAELEARVTKLRAEQSNEEYRSMTSYLFPQAKEKLAFKEDVRSVSSQVAAVVNFVVAVFGSFFFAYKAVEYAMPVPNIPAQVLVGILTATAVALADLYFLARTI